ncbi:MAG: branched-chain amino acid ABC transporter permease [Bacillota bacterium]|nr:branched-chain amino acid ABC transporter permease [Bacillota bacterium]
MSPHDLTLQVIQQVFNGVSLGSIYALIALGYTMVYGIIRLINFAHGDIFMVGAFAGYFATAVYKLSFFPALVLAMVVAALTGVTIEFFAYRPIRKAGRISALITAIGVSFLLENAGLLILKPDPRAFPEVIPLTVYNVGGLIVNNRQVLILAVTFGLMFLLQWIVRYTKIGKAMRAVANDRDAAHLMGIDVNQVITVTFALGSALAAAAGVLVGIVYNRIDPLMGIMPGLKAFVAAVLGGIGIIPGAMIGGFVMGIVEVLVVAFISSGWKDAAAFVALIIILLVRPVGLLGRNVGEKV